MADEQPGEVPERAKVDRCFRQAESMLDELDHPNGIKGHDLRFAMLALVSALEGVARQIRDHDDTVYQAATAQGATAGDLAKLFVESGNANRQALNQGLHDLGEQFSAAMLMVAEKGR